APIATGWSDQLSGRDLHPLKIRAFPRRTATHGPLPALLHSRWRARAVTLFSPSGAGTPIAIARRSHHHAMVVSRTQDETRGPVVVRAGGGRDAALAPGTCDPGGGVGAHGRPRSRRACGPDRLRRRTGRGGLGNHGADGVVP